MRFRRVGEFIAAAALSAAALAGVASPARADSTGDGPQLKVRFGDLNLSSPAGVQTLYKRIRIAAEYVCGEPALPGSMIFSRAWTDCVATAVRRAIVTVNNRALTAYYVDRARASSRGGAG